MNQPPKTLKLYTKTGDTGYSQLITGARFPKHHPVFAHLGDLDELSAALGLAVTPASAKIKSELQKIQHHLLDLGALIAGSSKTSPTQAQITWLEQRIDYYQSQFGPGWYKNFLLPGGSELAARLDLSRSICRRAERSFTKLNQPKYLKEIKSVNLENWKLAPSYLNRLSDYLFALRCYLNLRAQKSESLHTA